MKFPIVLLTILCLKFLTLIWSKYREYADYLVDNYIGKNANFPPNIWTVFVNDSTRTTNNCEFFHSHFNEQFYKSHPNIFTFLEI
jgi:hypothetical protein